MGKGKLAQGNEAGLQMVHGNTLNDIAILDPTRILMVVKEGEILQAIKGNAEWRLVPSTFLCPILFQ